MGWQMGFCESDRCDPGQCVSSASFSHQLQNVTRKHTDVGLSTSNIIKITNTISHF